jgi:pantothenate kinase
MVIGINSYFLEGVISNFKLGGEQQNIYFKKSPLVGEVLMVEAMNYAIHRTTQQSINSF